MNRKQKRCVNPFLKFLLLMMTCFTLQARLKMPFVKMFMNTLYVASVWRMPRLGAKLCVTYVTKSITLHLIMSQITCMFCALILLQN